MDRSMALPRSEIIAAVIQAVFFPCIDCFRVLVGRRSYVQEPKMQCLERSRTGMICLKVWRFNPVFKILVIRDLV